MNKNDLFERFKTMSLEDLQGYMSAGHFINRLCSIIGVGLIVTMLMVQSVFAIAFGCFAVFVLANMASSATETISKVMENMQRFNKLDK